MEALCRIAHITQPDGRKEARSSNTQSIHSFFFGFLCRRPMMNRTKNWFVCKVWDIEKCIMGLVVRMFGIFPSQNFFVDATYITKDQREGVFWQLDLGNVSILQWRSTEVDWFCADGILGLDCKNISSKHVSLRTKQIGSRE